MSATEIDLLHSCLLAASRVLEFGLGASTIYMLSHYHKLFTYSIETDGNYIKKIRQNPIIHNACHKKRCHIHHADIGAVKGWGYPDHTEYNLYLNYTLNLWPTLDENFDLIVIDGRFRLCTACFALFFIPNAVFLFHDFFDRKYYFPLLTFIDIIEYKDSLIKYRRKDSIDLKKLVNISFESIFDPR